METQKLINQFEIRIKEFYSEWIVNFTQNKAKVKELIINEENNCYKIKFDKGQLNFDFSIFQDQIFNELEVLEIKEEITEDQKNEIINQIF